MTKLKPGDKRLSPEHKEHMLKICRKKGDPKIPGSGKKALPPELKEAMREKTPEALATMLELMDSSPNPMVRLKAAEYILSPFVAKAAQQVDVNHKHSIADMLAEINQMRLAKPAAEQPVTIDITPNEPVTVRGSEDDA
ncbi:MAG: hypothetical protein Q8807_03285 ['Waltheria sp.' little leaf phytoplasma]|nr:hypothetical protein ['Waltheria sp.' little leaf phytoplasma]